MTGGRTRIAAAGVLAGLLVAASLPPLGWWPLGWLAMGIVAHALRGLGWRRRLLLGATLGAGNFVPGLWWVQEFSVAGYVVVVVISGLYYAAAVALVPTGRRRWVALALPATMVLAEAARDHFPLGGLPLAGLPLGQAAGPMAPVLRLGGGLALTGETVLAGVVLAEIARLAGRSRPPLPAVGVLAVLAVLVPVAGLLSPSGAGGPLPSLRVALVQGGGPRGTRAVNTDPQIVFDRHLAASTALEPPLDLVVWPEGVLQSHLPFERGQDAAAVAGLAVRVGATVLVGAEQDVGTTRYLNEVVAWSPAGKIVGTYVKNHLVPFGEYVPYRSLIQRLFNVADVPYDGIPGHGPGYLRTPAGPLAIMISYEVFFDARARGGVRAGGQLLVVPTNTASYRSDQVPAQEVAADRMRAWESGRWLVQVTPTGYSDVVSPTGGVVRTSRLGARQIIEATVPRMDGMTVYDRLGDLPVVAAAGASLIVSLLGTRRRRRA